MSYNFHVGMKVVCIDDDPNGHGPAFLLSIDEMDGLKADSVYTIRALEICLNVPCVFLKEIVRTGKRPDNEPRECPFALSRFRPAVETKTDISILEKLLNARQKETIDG